MKSWKFLLLNFCLRHSLILLVSYCEHLRDVATSINFLADVSICLNKNIFIFATT